MAHRVRRGYHLFGDADDATEAGESGNRDEEDVPLFGLLIYIRSADLCGNAVSGLPEAQFPIDWCAGRWVDERLRADVPEKERALARRALIGAILAGMQLSLDVLADLDCSAKDLAQIRANVFEDGPLPDILSLPLPPDDEPN